ncbi:hypothetical protein DPM19_26135 [Actinomadura craniellae]|uniref:Uncharacterized protein n=1 Tax=Actinomadura craniellae TaxID=2231787 RepID=A0A365GZD8_9ACTN|nr:hypothetical protein DPM19_26135 [Actinomadura craniellae]
MPTGPLPVITEEMTFAGLADPSVQDGWGEPDPEDLAGAERPDAFERAAEELFADAPEDLAETAATTGTADATSPAEDAPDPAEAEDTSARAGSEPDEGAEPEQAEVAQESEESAPEASESAPGEDEDRPAESGSGQREIAGGSEEGRPGEVAQEDDGSDPEASGSARSGDAGRPGEIAQEDAGSDPEASESVPGEDEDRPAESGSGQHEIAGGSEEGRPGEAAQEDAGSDPEASESVPGEDEDRPAEDGSEQDGIAAGGAARTGTSREDDEEDRPGETVGVDDGSGPETGEAARGDDEDRPEGVVSLRKSGKAAGDRTQALPRTDRTGRPAPPARRPRVGWVRDRSIVVAAGVATGVMLVGVAVSLVGARGDTAGGTPDAAGAEPPPPTAAATREPAPAPVPLVTRAPDERPLPVFRGRASPVRSRASTGGLSYPVLGGRWALGPDPRGVTAAFKPVPRTVVRAGSVTRGWAEYFLVPLPAALGRDVTGDTPGALARQVVRSRYPGRPALSQFARERLDGPVTGWVGAFRVRSGPVRGETVVVAVVERSRRPMVLYMTVPTPQRSVLPDVHRLLEGLR